MISTLMLTLRFDHFYEETFTELFIQATLKFDELILCKRNKHAY